MQKDLIPLINCPLCCMDWFSWDVIRSSHLIHTRSHRIHVVIKFYNHMSRLQNGCIPMRYFSLSVLLGFKKHLPKINARQQIVVLCKQLSVRTHQTNRCESAFLTLQNLLKLPKASVNVQKMHSFPLNAQIEMVFIIDIMPNFQHEQLYSPFLMCFK